MNDKIKDKLIDVLIRTVKTMAETMLGFLVHGMAISDVEWGKALSVTLLAGLITILVNIASIPTTKIDSENTKGE